MRQKLTALLVLLALAGVEQARGQQSELPPPIAFWKTLGDTTLVRLVGEVVKSNHDVVAGRARLRGSRASRVQAALDFAPAVTATASYTRQRLASASFPGGFGTAFPDQNVWDAGLQLSWELDVFGRIRKTTQGRGALIAAAEEDVQDLQVLLASELASAYFDLRGAQDRLQVARRNAENQQHTLDVTLQRLEAGRGNEPNADIVVRLRPDVRSAERQLSATSAFVGAAKAAYLPRISIGGGAGYVGSSFDALGNSNKPRYAIGPVISWPALDLGRVKAGVDVARAQEAEADAYYRKAQLQASQDIATAIVTYNKARRSLDYLDAAARASERAAGLARLRFVEGATDFLQVLDAERTMLEAQDRLAAGRTAATRGLAQVYRALGGALP